ncbi:MAG: hypothetical protein EBX37_18705, partial [Alphaproteobacteria bacterium]|nr:hypothetical protein [Alphaproteobacteria bacterium]
NFDGGMAQMLNYLDAVERNKDRYAGGGKTYGDYFAKASKPGYAPSAARITPLEGKTVREQSQERVAKMDATLDATITRMETAIRNDRGTFRDSSQRAPGPVVNVLRDIQRDAADGVLGNSGVDYRNVDAFLPKAEEMQLWMKVRKQVSGDSRVQDPDVQQLERDREVVVKALKGSHLAPKDLRKNPELAEALEHLTKGIAIEFTMEPRAQTPLPARPAKTKTK